MEMDSVHVVKRIVALLVDSFQPSHLPPAQQVRSRNTDIERHFHQELEKSLDLLHPKMLIKG